MKKPQNRFIEEIEKDSAGSFAGSSENRSSGAGVAGKNDSSRKCGARRDYSVATKVELVEILYFKHFYEHFTFGETDWSKRGKRLEKYVRVAIAIELVTVGTKLEDL